MMKVPTMAAMIGVAVLAATTAEAQQVPIYSNYTNIRGLGSEQFAQRRPARRGVMPPQFSAFRLPRQVYQDDQAGSEGSEQRQESGYQFHAERRREVHVAAHPAEECCEDSNIPEGFHVNHE